MLGGLCGLAWSSALRGWMAQLAEGMPDSHSEVTWLTLGLVLLPGTVVGALLGCSAYLRVVGRPGPRWLVLSPAIFVCALLDPKIFLGLVRSGTGGGSLIVVATALSVGYVLTRPAWSASRAVVAAIGVTGLLVIFGMGGLGAPLGRPRGAWLSLYGLSLVLLLGLASALPYDSTRRTHGTHLGPPLATTRTATASRQASTTSPAAPARRRTGSAREDT